MPSRRKSFALDVSRLGDDVLALLLAPLKIRELIAVDSVCKRWRFDSSKADLWYDLAAVHNIALPLRTSRGLRSKTDLRKTFIAACATQHAARLRNWDSRAMAIVRLMRSRDALVSMDAELRKHPQLPVAHVLDPADRGGHATLLHAACRYGRVMCATHLLNAANNLLAADMARTELLNAAFEASGVCNSNPLLEIADAGGCTPLIEAAWSGHLDVVKVLLARGAATEPAGVPPLTSSCGGRGPFDAQTWADRKGYDDVARAIRAAYHVRKYYHFAHGGEDVDDSSAGTSARTRSSGEARVSDFGCVAELQDSFGKCGTFVGTVPYMSPERIQGESYSYASDIWALGLTLFESAVGHFPYARTHANAPPPPRPRSSTPILYPDALPRSALLRRF